MLSAFSFGQGRVPVKAGMGFAVYNSPYSFGRIENYDSVFVDIKVTKSVNSEALMPYYYKPDYGLFHFVCLDSTTDCYHILYNDSSDGYVSKRDYHFITWDSLILNSTGVYRLANINVNNPLREKPNSNSDLISYNCKFDDLAAVDLKRVGNTYWVKVVYFKDCKGEDPFYTYPDLSIFPSAWIMWRINEQLLIELAMLC